MTRTADLISDAIAKMNEMTNHSSKEEKDFLDNIMASIKPVLNGDKSNDVKITHMRIKAAADDRDYRHDIKVKQVMNILLEHAGVK